MTSIAIALPDDRLQKSKDIADRFRVAPEDLVRTSVEELLTRPEAEFRRALEFVLKKNAELYRRLAWCAISQSRKSWKSAATTSGIHFRNGSVTSYPKSPRLARASDVTPY